MSTEPLLNEYEREYIEVQVSNKKKIKCSGICFLLLGIVFFGSQIVLGSVYYNEITCNNILTVPTWLIACGILGMLLMLLYGIDYLCATKTTVPMIIGSILIIICILALSVYGMININKICDTNANYLQKYMLSCILLIFILIFVLPKCCHSNK